MNYYPHHIGDFNSATRVSDLPVVYALASHDLAHVKIGKTRSIKQRITNIQSGCPFPLWLWLTIRTPHADRIERDLHSEFAQCRTRGEWFAPSGADLDRMMEFFVGTNQNIREVSRALL